MAQPPLTIILQAASALAGNTTTAKHKTQADFAGALRAHLRDFHLKLGTASPLTAAPTDESSTSQHDVENYIDHLRDENVESVTAEMALWAVTRVHAVEAQEQDPARPILGTRDLAQMRMLLALVLKWGLQPKMDRVLEHRRATVTSSAPSTTSIVEIVDDEVVSKNLAGLVSITNQLLLLVFISTASSTTTSRALLHQSHITQILVTRHITPLLKACILLGWDPDSDDGVNPRRTVDHLLSILPISQSLASLGSIISQLNFPPYSAACGKLLTQQLLKPGGVRGLCSSVLGEGATGEAAPLQKLESVARILSTTPAGMNHEEYHSLILPPILATLSPPTHDDGIQTPAPESHKRAAALTVSRMLTTRPKTASTVLFRLLLAPFFPSSSSSAPSSSATDSLQTLQALLMHVDPSPALPTHLLSPILPPLHALLAQMDKTRTADPALKELVRGLVRVWAGTVDTAEATKGWWGVMNSGGGWAGRDDVSWKVVGDEAYVQVESGSSPAPRLFTPADRKALDEGSLDADPLDLRPDPRHLVALLNSIGRKDVNSTLLVRALDEYQALHASDGDPLRTMLYLRFVLEMVEQLGSGALTQPDHVISFVAHALRPDDEDQTKKQKYKNVNGAATVPVPNVALRSLRIVELEDPAAVPEEEDNEDSDDESDDDLLDTGLNLLLAVLEANESLTSMNTPLLQVIEVDVERLTNHSSTTIRALAREARLVLTARNASTSTTTGGCPTSQLPDARQAASEKYQQALKLLQDPILPVRAHGLVLLKDLVLSSAQTPTAVDPALIPGILSIFLQLVQEDDSYIFLNAVQGLVAMADVLGKDILRGLVDAYAGGGLLEISAPTEMSKAQLDMRVRVGEALSQFIKKRGDAIGIYVNILVPSLFGLVRSRHLPVTLRTSALSLLALCAEASPLAILPWCADLCSGVVDLIQLEGVSVQPLDMLLPEKEIPLSQDDGDGEGSVQDERRSRVQGEEMDAKPLSRDPKIAPLRRSALHFITILLRSLITDTDSHDSSIISTRPIVSSIDTSNFRVGRVQATPSTLHDDFLPREVMRKMRIVLGYARATDADAIVRVMAGEVLELVTGLERRGIS